MRGFHISLTLMATLTAAVASPATTIHVPGDYETIQAGIDVSVDGDTVLVAAGTYTGDGNRDIDFTGKAIVVMSENGPEVTIIDCEGSLSEYHRGFNFHSGEDSASVLHGFTITHGWTLDGGGICCSSSSPTIINNIMTRNYAWVPPPYWQGIGGGMSIYDSSPTVSNCTFNGNSAMRGGGISNHESSPRVTNCMFSGNSAEEGGGMSNEYSSPMITHCTFTENSSGGMLNAYSSPMITHCTFSRNSGSYGGGMSNYESSPRIVNCTFNGNSAEWSGGGMRNSDFSGPTVTHCTFSGNTASEGGGMSNYESSPTVSNCTFTENSSEWGCGGGMRNGRSSNPTVTNCTFSGNTAAYRGGGMANELSSPTVTNCILWGNLPAEIANLFGGDPVVTYSNVQGGWEGEGNSDIDPLFRDPVSSDFHLMAMACGDSADSPCIDAGCPTDTDSLLDCSHGLGTERCDMGAYGGGGAPVLIDEPADPPVMQLPKTFRLAQNYPNPFNPSTTIAFDIPGAAGTKSPISLIVYDPRGRRVRTLVDSELKPGTHTIHWDGRDDRGQPFASGIYLYTLKTGDEIYTRKMVLLK